MIVHTKELPLMMPPMSFKDQISEITDLDTGDFILLI